MYDTRQMGVQPRRSGWLLLAATFVALGTTPTETAHAQEYAVAHGVAPNIVRHISRGSERLEMTASTSRILTLDKNIPQVQVNNPDIVVATPLSPNQVQLSAKKPGVTQVNLWDEEKKIHTVDVIVYGDVRELEVALKTQFPNSSVKVVKFSQSLMLSGMIDSPGHVDPIIRLAEDYAPKVINNLKVGGVQQILLKVKVMEVSRTKARALGVDWAHITGSGGYIGSKPSGLLANLSAAGTVDNTTFGGTTIEFGIVSGNNDFFGFIEALQQHNVAKILAEPNIVSVSGRPAQFLEGGEVPILVPQSLGTSSIEFKPFGTEVDFLPIVLGNGNIRLEVRPRVSDIDPSIGIQLNDQSVPGFRVRQADTAVEMKAGQTFALAGLIQQKVESVDRGLPFLADIPVIGVPFRRVEEEVNEIELLILVTPEFVDAMDPCEVPRCGPGTGTMSPDNSTLYWGGHIEVPAQGECGTGCVPAADDYSCDPCNSCGYCNGSGCSNCNGCDSGSDGGCLEQGPSLQSTPNFQSAPNLADPPYPTEPAYPAEDGYPSVGSDLGVEYQGPRPQPNWSGPQGHPQAWGTQVYQAALPGAPQPGYGAQQPMLNPSMSNQPMPSRPAEYRRQPVWSTPPALPAGNPSAAGQGQRMIGPVGYDRS